MEYIVDARTILLFRFHGKREKITSKNEFSTTTFKTQWKFHFWISKIIKTEITCSVTDLLRSRIPTISNVQVAKVVWKNQVS